MGKLMKKMTTLALGMSMLVGANVVYATETHTEGMNFDDYQGREDDGTTAGEIEVAVNYSDDITPSVTDDFVIEYSLKDHEDEVWQIKVNAFSFAEENGVLKDVPYGSYSILNIEYVGENEEIVEQGYAITKSFYCSSGTNGSFTIAIGSKKIAALAKDYSEGSLRIKDSEHDEYGNATRDKVGSVYYDPESSEGDDKLRNISAEKRQEERSSGTEHESPSNEAVGGENSDSENTITDDGSAKEIIYEKEEKPVEDAEDDPNKSTVAGRLIGVAILAIIGFATIYFAHKRGIV